MILTVVMTSVLSSMMCLTMARAKISLFLLGRNKAENNIGPSTLQCLSVEYSLEHTLHLLEVLCAMLAYPQAYLTYGKYKP